ncbi:MAG: hypothetical protein JW776_13100 [Candidatus Lokiarchaeota archaeon]|nr:hypothetical protein [Candidatus Lokiarchaeota archaeon]
MSDEYSSETDVDKITVTTKIKKLDRKYGKVTNLETKVRDPFIPPSIETKIRETYIKNRGFTPNDVAIKNDIRVSAAKKLLEKMEKDGSIELVTSTSRLKVYRGTAAKSSKDAEEE